MREDILKIIRGAKDVTNAVILTHNIDFVFLQSVVIPALRRCGQPALTVFADAECAAEAFPHQLRVLRDLGSRYRVVPIAMHPGFRFHPKALLLSGPEKATLLVGSGNLTFGGWRENGEVWLRYDTDSDGTGPFAALRNYLQDVLARVPLRESVEAEVEETFDPNTRAWAAELGEPDALIGRAAAGPPLLDRMKEILGARPVERLFVCTPYFDPDAEALRAMANALRAPETSVFVQSKRTTLMQDAAATLGETFKLVAVEFHHTEKAESEGEDRTRYAFVHAKFYAVESGDSVLACVGSANCSRAALTIPGTACNAELMGVRELSKSEFKRSLLDELIIGNAEPELLSTPIEPPAEKTTNDYVRIRGARFDLGTIQIAFDCGAQTAVRFAELDGQRTDIFNEGHGRVRVDTTHPHRVAVLVADCRGAEIRSSPHWIDNEADLGASARGRSLAEAIHRRVRGGVWSIGSLTDVLTELCRHLQYMPKAMSWRRASGEKKDGRGTGPVEFVWEDVFSDSYGLSMRSFLPNRHQLSSDERIGGLRSLILRWYGITQPEHEQDPEGADDVPSHDTAVTTVDDDGDPSADRPAALPKSMPRVAPTPPSDRERKRVQKIVNLVVSRMSDTEFLSERPPTLLSGDLKIVALLLRAGLADDWLTEQEFFDATLGIWLPLFFNAVEEKYTGWLERRHQSAEDPQEFADSMRSVELSAALACWALSVPERSTSPEHTRFALACILAVARLPWIWQTGGPREIARQVADVFAHTSDRVDADWQSIEKRWLTLIRRGRALGLLHNAILRTHIVELRTRIRQTQVNQGELLWQGRYGFCVATEDCQRIKDEKGTVVILQQADATKKFLGNWLMPVAGMLGDQVLGSAALPTEAARILQEMVEELRVGWQ